MRLGGFLRFGDLFYAVLGHLEYFLPVGQIGT
jgi:hypothetical protein